MKYSDQVLDENVFPKLSLLTKCGAPPLSRTDNHFAKFLHLSSLGQQRFKKPLHSLLVVFYRRVDFACVAYRQGRNQLLKYTSKLPDDNSQTRHVRLSMCYFETCIIHLTAALKCGEALSVSLKHPEQVDERVRRLKALSNRIRHFDEDVYKNGKLQDKFGIAPIWMDDTGLLAEKSELKFCELADLLREVTAECVEFNKLLSEPVK
jgi:hypothetical protein